jgi:chromosome partitioning protein
MVSPMDPVTPERPRLACCNHKGGVGKTTCAVNLAAGLTRLGWRVLAVDADPQAHLTAALGLTAPEGGGLAGALRGRIALDAALVATETLTVLPGSAALAAVEGELSDPNDPGDRLARLVDCLSGYDAVLFDCPPHLGPLTRQVLTAATAVLVPMTPDFLAMQSLAWLMDTLAKLSREARPGPSVLGIALNRFSAHKRLHSEVRSAVRAHFPGLPFATVLRENVALAEAPSFGQDIFRYAPKSAGASDFAALCRETAARLGKTVSPPAR